MMHSLIITRPDDWHLHLRDGDYLKRTVPDAARRFARALIMPNLTPPITTIKAALEYRERILARLPDGTTFEPLMSLYLTDQLQTATIIEAKRCPHIYACKLYPANSTTNSEAGVQSIQSLYGIFETMQSVDLPLLIHGECGDPEIDVFDREHYFIERELQRIIETFPRLRIVLEHISTQCAVEFIKQAPSNVAATITAHHLSINRNDLLGEAIKPHYYCKPIVKCSTDQHALLQAAMSGNPKFFLGTDSAPHSKQNKENDCGCAGIYTSHAAIELYAELFANAGALDKLEHFASHFGADFYQLPYNKEKLKLIKQQQTIAPYLDFAQEQLIPFRAGSHVDWSIVLD